MLQPNNPLYAGGEVKSQGNMPATAPMTMRVRVARLALIIPLVGSLFVLNQCDDGNMTEPTTPPPGSPAIQYSGQNLESWEIVLGDGIYAAPGEPPVSLADIETVHLGDHSELRANLQTRRIAGHNITFKRVTNSDLHKDPLTFLHTAQYLFRLPHPPDLNSLSLNGQTVEGHLAIWDGRDGARVDAIVGWQWIVNPQLTEFGDLRIWVGPDPGQWKKVGHIQPDTAWHPVKLRLDRAQGRATIQFDNQEYTDALTLMTRPGWGPEVAARFAAEAISSDPGLAGSGSFHRVEFRDWVWTWD